MYKLIAHLESFAGTFADYPDRNEKTLFFSENKQRLEIIQKFMGSSEYSTAHREFVSTVRRNWNAGQTLQKGVTKSFDFGTVTIPFVGLDFYGDGNLTYLSIEGIETPISTMIV